MSLSNDSLKNSDSSAQPATNGAANLASKQMLLNVLTAVILLAVVCCGFSKTVFQGAPISRLYQLGQRDTLFAKYFTPIREGYDASVYQYFVPCHHFLVENLRKGIVPLWNPLVGCGEPFMADIETATFAPLRASLIWMEPIRSWNLLIVLNLVVFSIGTFFLGILTGLRRFAAIFAALLCAFCPFIIFHSELIGSSSSWIPLVIASFVWVEKTRTPFSRAMAGAACALMIVSGHPEPSFFGISTASLAFLLFRGMASPNDTAPKRIASVLSGFLDIAQIGLFAFAFSAPLLIPFAELLKSSDCYKLGLTEHRIGVPLNSILINLVHPAYDRCSPFLGILAIPLFISAAVGGFKQSHYLRGFLASMLLLVCMMSQLGPLDFIMNLPSFSWFVPKYCFPSLLVVACVLMGFGIQELTDKINSNWKLVCICIISGSLVVLASLIAIKFAPSLLECVRQDEAFDKMAVINKQWTKDIIILTVFCAITFVTQFLPRYRSALIVLAVSICTILSIAPLTKTAAPVNAGLNYDLVDPIPFLKERKERIVSMGRHTFCPSSNFVYGINNIVPVNVYHPTGFLSYLSKCGITPEGVNQFFDNDLSPEIDLSATKYVVSPYPVLSTKQAIPDPISIDEAAGARWQGEPELALEAASLVSDPTNHQATGTLRFKTSAKRAKQIGVQALLRDDKGNAIWFSDIDRILYLFAKNDPEKIDSFNFKMKVAIPKFDKKLSLALQIFDFEQSRFIPFSAGQADPEAPGVLELAEISPDGSATSNIVKVTENKNTTQSIFRLVSEAPNRVRVYENTKALEYCYLTKKPDDPNAEKTSSNVKWTRPDCNTIRAELDAPEQMYLVVAEFFEPHWNAMISHDNSQSKEKIIRANKYFQAIAVPKGKSVLTLSYEPLSYKIGLGIFALGLLTLSILAFKKRGVQNKAQEATP